jgi:hypothetical protein
MIDALMTEREIAALNSTSALAQLTRPELEELRNKVMSNTASPQHHAYQRKLSVLDSEINYRKMNGYG